MKHISGIRILLLILAVFSSWVIEIAPVFTEEHEKAWRIVYALAAILLTMFIENVVRRNEFHDRIVEFIRTLKGELRENSVQPKLTQAIMQATTKQLSEALEQKGFLNSNDRKKFEPEEIQCGICDSLHKTDANRRCTNCRIAKKYWEKIVEDRKS
jgi:hypothetical protein